MELMIIAGLLAGLLGLVMGSFAGAQVWRLRARQLATDTVELASLTKKQTQTDLTADEAEYLTYLTDSKRDRANELKRLQDLATTDVRTDRSRCLECGHELAWYDLIPLASWVSTRGRCRYCKVPIGRFEPLMELGTAVVFVGFTLIWLNEHGAGGASLGLLALWLAALVMFVILFAYDLKWFLLPDSIMFPLIAVSFVISGLDLWLFPPETSLLTSLASGLGSVIVLSGLYFVLWVISRGRWVGFGDVKLGIALGVLLLDWKLALLTLLLANLIGTLIVIPGLISGRLSRKTQVPFGPLLIGGFFIALLYGTEIISGYEQASLWLSTTLLML